MTKSSKKCLLQSISSIFSNPDLFCFGVNTAPPRLRSLSTGALGGKHSIVHTKQFLDGWVFVEALNSFAITHPPPPPTPTPLTHPPLYMCNS